MRLFSSALRAGMVFGLASLLSFAAGCSSAAKGPEDSNAPTYTDALSTSIASIALANVGRGACSTNSEGGRYYESSCTGNGGRPEYWCADFVQWVWQAAGADTAGLDAAAGSFYTYGQRNGTLHSSPSVGDAVVFNYQGNGWAEHVAIVTEVNANGTIETASGDWGGESGSEATFGATSHVVVNAPAYAGVVGERPAVIGMTISGFVSPAGSSGGGGGGTSGSGCYSSTLGKEVPNNACVESAANHEWYQCDNGAWADRWSDPNACDGVYPL